MLNDIKSLPYSNTIYIYNTEDWSNDAENSALITGIGVVPVSLELFTWLQIMLMRKFITSPLLLLNVNGVRIYIFDCSILGRIRRQQF